jgi:putative ABC transport system permease protein
MTSGQGGFRRMCRRLLRTPLFTAVTILTLGIGIGATTAIFSVVYGVLLKPLPFVEPDRLVGVWHTAPGMKLDLLNQSPSTYFTYREESRTFEDTGLWLSQQVTMTGRGEPERIGALLVTDGLLPLLGVRPHLGRLISKADDSPGAPGRALLAYGFWQRRFGGSPDVLGRQLTIEGRPVEIIGVLPQSFSFLRTTQSLVMPLGLNRAETFIGNFSYQGIARLKPGVTIDDANRDVARMLPITYDRYPLPPGFRRDQLDAIRIAPRIRPLMVDAVGDIGSVLWVLLGTVGIVLLIACANVANLYLVRSEARQQEFALRAALGASRGRMARELLGESVTLGIVAGAVGLVLAELSLALLREIAPAGLPRLDEIRINAIVVSFTLGISILSGLLFGIIPVLKFGKPKIAALKEGGRSSSDGPSRHRTRNVLVVAEIALALVLLIVSGLMIRTFVALNAVDPGFRNPEDVQTFRIFVPDALVKEPEAVLQLERQIADNLARVPGVSSVGITSSVTMDGNDSNDPIFIEEFPTPVGQMPPLRRYKWIGPGYVETMGNRIVAGRAPTWEDSTELRQVVLISERFAREIWKDPRLAIGKRVRQGEKNPWKEIVGVVGDERDNGVSQAAPTIVYWPLFVKNFWAAEKRVERGVAYVVRSPRTNSPTLMKELQQAVWSANSNLPLANVQTLDEIRASSMAQTSFALSMLGIAAGVALLLGIVGIYGVIAYIAAQRTREIGIRMALGAQSGDVSRLFVRHGLWLTGAGVALGVLAAVGLTRLMSSLLFGVSPMDPTTYAAVSVALGAVALLATYLPARRAARIDPIVALRTDV